MSQSSLGILIVSFGTSITKTRQQTLDTIEAKIRHTYSSYAIYVAWMSETLRKKVSEQEQLHIPSVPEALNQMKDDGISHVIIQPLFVADGHENQLLIREAQIYANDFSSLQFGSPLLGTDADIERVSKELIREVDSLRDKSSKELFVFMGHGTACNPMEVCTDTDRCYRRTDAALQSMSRQTIALKLMNSDSAIEEIAALAETMQTTSIILAPFMLTAGRHAVRDMAGDHKTSWESKLKAKGFSVRCIFKGLGEYETIQNQFLDHVLSSITQMPQNP